MKIPIRGLWKKKAVQNGMWLYFLQICNTVIPLITLPYITRILGASKYGMFSIAINLVGYLQAIVEYGFGMSATRKIALLGNDEANKLNKIFSGVLYSRIILFIFSFIISILYIKISKLPSETHICIIILELTLIGISLQLNWLFQGKQEMKFISISSIIARSISVCGIFIFVKQPSDIFLYCLLYAFSPILVSVLGLIFACQRYQIRLVKLKLEEIIDELKSGWYVFTTQLSSKIFGAIGITFLGVFSTDADVGIYSAVQKIPYILLMVWAPVSQVLYPISSKKMSDSYLQGKKFIYKMRKYVFIVFGVIACLIALFAKIVIAFLFGKEYGVQYTIIYPLLIWVLLGINNNFWGIQLMLGSGHDKEYSRCFQLGVLCTVLFNFILIYAFKSWGAAIAPAFSEGVLAVALFKNMKKIEKRVKT
ncbi:MAG: flippase [Lachnospiraceae bacterium]|jgi:O-antigen/teichoic acid export membrane protein|nr:flippase [Lachnospiraceae bacterium]